MADEHEVEDIIQRMGSLFEILGKSPVTGKVLGLLYFKGGLTQEQLKNELGCSLSAVSQAMNYLKNIGLIVSEKGEDRKKRYRIEFSKQRIKGAIEKFIFFGLNPMINFLDEKERKIKDNGLKQKAKAMRKAYAGFKEKFANLHLLE